MGWTGGGNVRGIWEGKGYVRRRGRRGKGGEWVEGRWRWGLGGVAWREGGEGSRSQWRTKDKEIVRENREKGRGSEFSTGYI